MFAFQRVHIYLRSGCLALCPQPAFHRSTIKKKKHPKNLIGKKTYLLLRLILYSDGNTCD